MKNSQTKQLMDHEHIVHMERIRDGAWVASNLLTEEECCMLRLKAEQKGLSSSNTEDRRHRNSDGTEIDDEGLSQLVWERLKDLIPQEVWVGDDHPPVAGVVQSREMYGRWTPYEVNSRWRVHRYPGGGHFGPHRDSGLVEDENHRSMLTINGYLTALPSGHGGATFFLTDEQEPFVDSCNDRIIPAPGTVINKVEADQAGKAVVFFHDLMHAGEVTSEECPVQKWIFRSEVMYCRDPSTSPEYTAEELDARFYLRQAMEQERVGDISSAIKSYKMAYRLDPSLEDNS